MSGTQFFADVLSEYLDVDDFANVPEFWGLWSTKRGIEVARELAHGPCREFGWLIRNKCFNLAEKEFLRGSISDQQIRSSLHFVVRSRSNLIFKLLLHLESRTPAANRSYIVDVLRESIQMDFREVGDYITPKASSGVLRAVFDAAASHSTDVGYFKLFLSHVDDRHMLLNGLHSAVCADNPHTFFEIASKLQRWEESYLDALEMNASTILTTHAAQMGSQIAHNLATQLVNKKFSRVAMDAACIAMLQTCKLDFENASKLLRACVANSHANVAAYLVSAFPKLRDGLNLQKCDQHLVRKLWVL